MENSTTNKMDLNLIAKISWKIIQAMVCASLLVLLTHSAMAQAENTQAGLKNPDRTIGRNDNFSDVNRPIAPGDVLDIQIDKAPELSGQFRVDAKGMIYMKFLGDMRTKDLTLDELNKKITEGLRGRYLNDPHVRIAITDYYKYSFIIQGAVKKPGVYQLVEERPTFWTLIVNAGGFDKECGNTAFVIRTNKTGDAEDKDQEKEGNKKSDEKDAGGEVHLNREVIRVKISGLMKGDLRQDIQLLPGDVITIPSADVFFIAGEVNAPGRFTLADGTTLGQAISLAQGTTITASKGKGKIFRENPTTGSLEELAVDIGAVMDGKKPDILLVANDIVVVPGSRFKSVGTALLRSIGMGGGQIPFRRF